jgi:hypothetical protein
VAAGCRLEAPCLAAIPRPELQTELRSEPVAEPFRPSLTQTRPKPEPNASGLVASDIWPELEPDACGEALGPTSIPALRFTSGAAVT